MVFYLQNQLNDFMANRSSIGSRFYETSSLEFPTLTFCFDPAMKPNVSRKFGVMDFASAYFKELNLNLTLPQRIHKMSYILNRDYEIYVGHLHLNKTKIQIGKNSMVTSENNNWIFKAENVVTWIHGTCLKLQLLHDITKIPGYLELKVVVKEPSLTRGFDIYLTSKQTWMGVVNDNWPRFRPSKESVNFEDDLTEFRLQLTKWKYQNGVSNTSACFDRLSMELGFNCSLPYFGSLPPCETAKEQERNWNETMKYYTKYLLCNTPIEGLTYNPMKSRPQLYQSGLFLFYFTYLSITNFIILLRKHFKYFCELIHRIKQDRVERRN